jgi:IS5 family transposase
MQEQGNTQNYGKTNVQGKDTRYQKDKKRKQCRRRAVIEPIIGDHINLLMAAAAWNLKQWLLAIFWFFFP